MGKVMQDVGISVTWRFL